MARKIVQVAISEDFFVAVADDGTLWSYSEDEEDEDGEWKKMPALPQD